MKSPRNFGSGGYGEASRRGLSQHWFQHAEQHERDEERNDDIESLGGEERPQQIAVLPGNDILEARIEPHADEGQREKYRREHFGDTRLGKFAPGIGREKAVSLQYTEYQRCGNEADDEFREFLPHDPQRRGLPGLIAAARREVKRDEERHHADQYVLRSLDDDGMLVGHFAHDHARRGDTRRSVDRTAAPATSCTTCGSSKICGRIACANHGIR